MDAFNSGRARDPILGALARALWYLSAKLQVKFKFVHIPGVDMCVADALSRAGNSQRHYQDAQRYINELSLKSVQINAKHFIYSSFFDR